MLAEVWMEARQCQGASWGPSSQLGQGTFEEPHGGGWQQWSPVGRPVTLCLPRR